MSGPAPSAPPRLLISCVSEDLPKWHARVLNLILSVREFAGAYKDVRFVAYFVGGVDAAVRREIEALDAEVRIVQPLKGPSGHANKLRMFEGAADYEFDVLLALDCDVVVVGDPSPWISTTEIGLKTADHDPFSDADWRRLHEAVDLDDPGAVVRTTTSDRCTRPYFNNGVITVPRSYCGALKESWETSHALLVEGLSRAPWLVPENRHLFSEQLSLGFALQQDGMPWRHLPVEMNFPTHLPVSRTALSKCGRPAILHYHGEVCEDGFLLRPQSAIATEPAHEFNCMRSKHLSTPYGGLKSRPFSERLRRSLPRRLRGIARVQRHRLKAASRRRIRRIPLATPPVRRQ